VLPFGYDISKSTQNPNPSSQGDGDDDEEGDAEEEVSKVGLNAVDDQSSNKWINKLDMSGVSHFESITTDNGEKEGGGIDDDGSVYNDMAIFRNMKQMLAESEQRPPYWFLQLNALVRHGHLHYAAAAAADSAGGDGGGGNKRNKRSRMSLGYTKWMARKKDAKKRKWDPKY
jgi:hypothetical protein